MNIRLPAIIISILVLAVAGSIFFFAQKNNQKNIFSQGLGINQSKNMKITSPVFENNGNIPAKYTCDGESINPPLAISDVPAETKSLALVLDDPDAPAPGGFVHWVVFNFDPKTAEIPANSVPPNAVQGQSSSGQSHYVSPCPPSGTHHYHFKLYALDSLLSLDSSAKREDVEAAMQGHILEQTEMIGLYQRP